MYRDKRRPVFSFCCILVLCFVTQRSSYTADRFSHFRYCTKFTKGTLLPYVKSFYILAWQAKNWHGMSMNEVACSCVRYYTFNSLLQCSDLHKVTEMASKSISGSLPLQNVFTALRSLQWTNQTRLATEKSWSDHSIIHCSGMRMFLEPMKILQQLKAVPKKTFNLILVYV